MFPQQSSLVKEYRLCKQSLTIVSITLQSHEVFKVVTKMPCEKVGVVSPLMQQKHKDWLNIINASSVKQRLFEMAKKSCLSTGCVWKQNKIG